MERLGLEDDVPIETRLVSKAIENAQTKVEGYNFDIRKHVVEYDDVMNKQREVIYVERNKVLRNEDLSETVRAFLEDEIDVLVDSHLVGRLEQVLRIASRLPSSHSSSSVVPGGRRDPSS